MIQDQIVKYPTKLKRVCWRNFKYLVYLPDFSGYTAGIDYDNALFMARDYIGTRSLFNELPQATKVLPEETEDELSLFVKVNITDFRRQYGVKTTGFL